MTTRPYEFSDSVHLQITFEFDLTLYRVDRDVYSVLDWVGDVGGLNEGLFIFFKILLAMFQFKALEHFLIEKLFHKHPAQSDDATRPESAEREELSIEKTSLFR